MRSLEEIESRAVRHLDGTRVNVDAMARDVVALVGTVRTLQAQVARIGGQATQVGGIGAAPEASLTKQFMEIFGSESRGG